MAKIDVVNVLGASVSKVELSDSVFAIEPHNQSMFDLVLSERASLRQGTHSTKTRTEVAGGGRKPWKQKGTGRARQGSIRSPQWRGGGVVFGPTPNRNYELKINKKVKKLALRSGWTIKAKANELFIIDDMTFKTPSTKDFIKMLSNLKIDNKKVLLILDGTEIEFNTYLSARNVSNVMPIFSNEIMLDDILNSQAVIFTEKVIKEIEGRLV